MKSRNKKRLLALVLCMVVAISNSSFIFASETGQTEYPQEVQTQDEAVADDMDVAAYAADEGQAVAEEQTAPVEQVAEEPVAEPEATVAAPAEQPTAETPAAEQPTIEAPAAEAPAAQAPAAQEPAAEESQETPATEEKTPGTETVVEGEETQEEPAEEDVVIYNQATTLRDDFTDENGNITATITAEIPEGAFEVKDGSSLTMEATTLSETETEHLETLMEKVVSSDKEFGLYVAYNITFKVDDTKVDSLKPIKITMTGDNSPIGEIENAKVFYLNPATVEGEEDSLEEIVQKPAMLKRLQDAGMSTDKMDEEYDLSEVTLNNDGSAARIQLEGRKSTVYGYYTESEIDPKTALRDLRVSITDSIMTDGLLRATPDAQHDDTDDVTYKWYKSVNNGEYTEVTQRKVGDNYKLAEDGSTINIAYDEGALNSAANRTSVQYKVRAYLDNEELCESAPYSVQYWNELQNGGFEKPVVSVANAVVGSDQTAGVGSNWQFSNENYRNKGGVWQTTGTTKKQSKDDKTPSKVYSDYPSDQNATSADIEIINTSLNNEKYKADYNWDNSWGANYTGAREGTQFAELNCEADGALYQDVLTIKGETLNYWLSHRARRPSGSTNNNVKDSMYVVIIPTSLALKGLNNDNDPIDTQDEVNKLIEDKDKYEGVLVRSCTSTAGDWTDYTGTYTAASYLTRFFFVSGSTASKKKTVGNFLDRVGFSQSLPPANPGRYSIQLQKKVSGLSETKYNALKEKLSFDITITKSSGIKKNSVKANKTGWKWKDNGDGTYTGTYNWVSNESINADEQYTVTIAENNADLTSYTRSTTVSVNGGTAEGADTTTFTVQERDSKVVTFNNSYTKNQALTPEPEPDTTVNVPHTKTIDYLGDGGNNPDTSLSGDEYYRLYLDVTGIPDQQPKDADVIFVLDVSRSMSFAMNSDDDEVADVQNQRITKLKSAASAAVNALMTGNNNVSVGIIPFHSWVDSSGNMAPLSVTSDQTSVIKYISNLNYVTQTYYNGAGGTNYQAAFQSAKTMLNSLSSDRKKYVVFVSDGQPTIYTTDSNTYGNNEKLAKAYGIDAAEELTETVGLNGFYTVSVGPNTGKAYLEKSITPAPAATVRKYMDAADEDKLKETFSAIAGSITKQIGNVTIEDTLSEYVIFANENGKALTGNKEITGTNRNPNAAGISLKVTTRQKGSDVSTAQVYSGSYTWKVDPTTKKVSVNFGSDYFLSRDTVYTISFNVKLTDKAYKDSMSNTGDAGTDYGNNTTSSQQKGFYSNSSATVKYSRVKNNKYVTETKDYDKPVVQSKVSHSVIKKWEGEKAVSVDVQLKAYVKDGSEKKDVTTDILGNADKIITLNAANEWKGKWTNLPNKYYENGGEIGKDIIYTVEETRINQADGVTRVYSTKIEESEDGYTTTITNSEKTDWQIVKKSSSENGGTLPNAHFELKSKKNAYTAVSDENGILQWKDEDKKPISTSDIEKGEYTLKETVAPTGYAVSNETWTVKIAYAGALPTILGENKKDENRLKLEGNIYTCDFLNTPVYDLPSTGHSGIFNIMMSGILLMFAGILIIYKMKGKGVLKK